MSVEQQIYGSLDIEGVRGSHHTHDATQGLDASTKEAHEILCRRWGQYEDGSPYERALVHRPVFGDDGALVANVTFLVTDQGRDSSGRPGAMLRHILRFTPDEYRAIGANPHRLLRFGCFLDAWTPGARLPDVDPAAIGHDDMGALKAILPPQYGVLETLLRHYLGADELHLHAARDETAAEELMEQLLHLIPLGRRTRLSYASFAYKRADDYDLAVVRRRDASFRRSLEETLARPTPSLIGPVEGYVQRLFEALRSSDYETAHRLTERTALPEPAPRVPRDDTTLEGITLPGRTLADGSRTTSARAETGTASAAEPASAPTPSPTPTVESSGSGRRPVGLVAVLVVVLAAAGVWFALGRDGGSNEPVTLTAPAAVSDWSELVDGYAATLGGYLARDPFDVELREALDGIEPRYRSARSKLEEQLHAETDRRITEALSGGATLAGALQGVATSYEAQRTGVGQRVAALDAALLSGGATRVERLRAMWDDAGDSLALAQLDVEDPDAGIVGVQRALVSQASVWTTAGALATLADWSNLAAAMAEAEPIGVASPGLVAQRDLVRAASRFVGADPGDPEDGVAVDGDARRALVEAARRLEAAWSTLPVALHATVGLADVLAARGGARGADEARAVLEALDRLDPDVVGPALAPWFGALRLEAWFALGSVEGASDLGLDPEGAAFGPDGGIAGLLRDRARARGGGSPAALAAAFRRSATSSDDPARAAWYRERADELASNAASAGASWERAYQRLRAAADAFARDPSASTWSELRRRARIDVTAEATGAQRTAIDDLRAWIGASRSVTIESVGVALEVAADYSGTTRNQLFAEVVFVQEGRELARARASRPSIFPAGAAIEDIDVAVGASIESSLGAPIDVFLRDAGSGAVWLHAHVAPGSAGNVLAALDGAHEVRPSAADRRALVDDPGSPAPPEGGGELRGTLRVRLPDDWWDAFVADLPELP